QRRNEPTLTAHENRSDLRRDDVEKESRTRIQRFPKWASRARHKQHEMAACDELKKHHRLQLRTFQVVQRVTEIKQSKTLNNAEQSKHSRDDQYPVQFPSYWLRRHSGVVERDCHNGHIVQEREGD